MIGVMRAANCIDIVLFHQYQVPFYEFNGYGAAILRVMVVAVDASEVDRTTVDLNQAVLQLDASKPDWLIDDLQGLSFGGQGDAQEVQIRMLSRPFQWVRKFPHTANMFRFPWH